jgi:hypothetical protein
MKTGAVLCLLLVLCAPCFAQTTDSVQRVNVLIKASLTKNFDAIQDEAANLTDVERLTIFTKNKMDPWSGGLVNLLGPLIIGGIANFGIGNFIQNDYLGGGITLAGNLTGGIVGIVGIVQLVGGDATGWILLGSGIATTVGFNLFGTIRAFIYPVGYNRKLKNALNVEHMVMNIKPSIDFTANGAELALVRLSF